MIQRLSFAVLKGDSPYSYRCRRPGLSDGRIGLLWSHVRSNQSPAVTCAHGDEQTWTQGCCNKTGESCAATQTRRWPSRMYPNKKQFL